MLPLLRLRKSNAMRSVLNMFDQGAAILVIVERTKICVSAVLALVNIKILLWNHTRYLKHLRKLSGPDIGQNLHFGGLTFGRKIKSMEILSFTYNFDHVLIYIMCKFHISTTFHWFFSPDSQFFKMQICSKIWLWTPSKILQMFYMIYFYFQKWF